MTDRWCPTCRSEWWIAVETCPDCGDVLVDELPPERAPIDDARDHEIVQLDLGDLDDAERWELGLRLQQHGIVSRGPPNRARPRRSAAVPGGHRP